MKSETKEEIREIVEMVNLLDLDTERKLTEKDSDIILNEAGFDSMAFIRLVLLVDERFQVERAEEVLFGISRRMTIAGIAEKLQNAGAHLKTSGNGKKREKNDVDKNGEN